MLEATLLKIHSEVLVAYSPQALANSPQAAYHSTLASLDGYIYQFSGADTTNLYSKNLYRYDLASNTWVARAPAPHAHMNGTLFAYSGKLYAIGGSASNPAIGNTVTDFLTFHSYDPITNSWTTLAPVPGNESLGRVAVAVWEGKFYVVAVGKTFIYHVATDTWTTVNNGLVVSQTAFIQIGTALYLGGPSRDRLFYRYDFLSNTWRALANMPLDIFYGNDLFEYAGKIYSVGGWNGTTYIRDIYVYDIARNTWALFRTSTPFALYTSRVIKHNKRWYCGTGSTNGGSGGGQSILYQIAIEP